MIKNNVFKKSLLRIAFILCLALLAMPSVFAASEYKDMPTGYTGTGCYMQVKNLRTNLYYAGIFNVNYENDLIIRDGNFLDGDILECDAFTSYSYGSYWVYKGATIDTLSREVYYKESDRTVEHLKFYVTIDARVTKVSCSASYNSQDGEQLSVTVFSTTDTVPPTVSVNSGRTDPTKVLIDNEITITGTDTNRLVGWKITTDSVKTTTGFTSFETPGTSCSISQVCDTPGTYYAWVIDSGSNVSNYAKFTVGTSPVGTVTTPGVRENESTRYTCIVSSGTSPYSYQWYIGGNQPASRTSTSSPWNLHGATKINDETTMVYNYRGVKSQDDLYAYCAVNNGYDEVFISAPITVYYKPTVSSKIIDATIVESELVGRVNKNGTATLEVNVDNDGNPAQYTYQWYSSKSPDESVIGYKVVEDTSTKKRFVFKPTEDQVTYFYCVVSNGQYEVRSNKVCVKVDTTSPTIDKGSFEENIYRNEKTDIVIPLIVTDEGHGFTPSNFEESHIIVKVNDVEVTPTTKKLSPKNVTGGSHYNYELLLGGVKQNGKLSLEIPANKFTDDYGNYNLKAVITTDIEIDNIDPVISFTRIISGQDQGYLSNKHTDLVIELCIEEKIGIDINEFETEDIELKAIPDGHSVELDSPLPKSYSKTLKFSHKDTKTGTGIPRYYYILTLSRIPGDGQLYIYVPTGSVNDWATNKNAGRNVDLQYIKVDGVIIDNTAPEISITKRFDNFSSTRLYPDSLESWHDGWANEDIYITVNARDDGGQIDQERYMVSRDNGATFQNLVGDPDVNKEKVSSDMNKSYLYRVYDKAGNYSTSTEEEGLIKLDKTKPAVTRVILHEERETGGEYTFNPDKPTNKTLYSIADDVNDLGSIQSGIKKDKVGSEYKSFYTITRYTSIDDRTQIGEVRKVPLDNTIDEGKHIMFDEDGYYEFVSTTYDLAGNFVVSPVYKMHIKKRTNNIITLKNIRDVGSGVASAEIKVYKGTDDTGTLLKSFYSDDLDKEYKVSVTLDKGTYFIKATVYDKVGNSKTITRTITNDL